MTVVTTLLALKGPPIRNGFVLTNIDTLGTLQANAADPLFHTAVPLESERWTGIVIHDSGEPAGDAETMTRKHMAMGYRTLGHHFLIGNGNGLGDGVVHVGDRWNRQLPGAHAIGPRADQHNQHSIAICLIGNGSRRPFTDRQMAQLANLVQRLQAELNIPARNVLLHREVAPQTDSPGRYFPAARFKEQLR